MSETPILTALIDTVQKLRIPLHVPGHKQGKVLPHAFAEWLGPAAKLDLTELPGLDNLQAPEGCILASEQLTAAHYKSARCLYSVNGSSAGVMAALMATARRGQVLFLNAFHQSAWRGLVFADAMPRFAAMDWDESAGTARPVSADELRRQLSHHQQVAAVFLTSPTYTGVVSDVRALAAVCKERGVPLIVDEAHGAHLGLCEELPPHSVAAGADVVVQSVHKMLPGLTQTAWIHVQGHTVDADAVEASLRMLQTTSPSYLLMASLDAAQAWLRHEGPDAARHALTVLERHSICALDDMTRDPFHHWIPTFDPNTSEQLVEALGHHGIYVEYADAMGVLSVFGFDVNDRTAGLYRRTVDSIHGGGAASPAYNAFAELYQGLPDVDLEVRPAETVARRKCRVPLADAAGRVAADMITPYPPGIPLVYPGQRLSPRLITALRAVTASNGAVHGIKEETIDVFEE